MFQLNSKLYLIYEESLTFIYIYKQLWAAQTKQPTDLLKWKWQIHQISALPVEQRVKTQHWGPQSVPGALWPSPEGLKPGSPWPASPPPPLSAQKKFYKIRQIHKFFSLCATVIKSDHKFQFQAGEWYMVKQSPTSSSSSLLSASLMYFTCWVVRVTKAV